MASAVPGRKPAQMKWKRDALGVRMPRSGSSALLGYIASFNQINGFLQFVLKLVSITEHNAHLSHSTLLKLEDDPTKKLAMIEKWNKRLGPVEDLKKHRQFFMEVILVRHVENYLNYLSSLLREIFLNRPEALRSSEKIDLELVLKHDSIDDLVKTIAERKVESLSYASFSELAQFFQEKFHIELVPDTKRALVIDAIETRNISVHNRCIINRRFLFRTGAEEKELGKVKTVWIDTVEKVASVLGQSAIAIDKDARKRLKVRGHRAARVA